MAHPKRRTAAVPFKDVRDLTFHEGQRSILECGLSRRIITSANRWGKTVTGLSEILMCARGVHRYRDVEPVPMLWITVPSYKAWWRIHAPILRLLAPRHWMLKWPSSDSMSLIVEWDERHGGGQCEVHILSYEQQPTDWVGAKVYGAWMDEPPPYLHYNELCARLADAGGWLMQTFTPTEGLGWWYNSIFKPAKEKRPGFEHWFQLSGAMAERDPENVDEFEVGRCLLPWMILPFQGDSVDPDGNVLTCKCLTIEEHGSCRACRDATIRFASNYADVADREIRVFGIVRGKQGLIYGQYDERIHVVPRFEITPKYDIVGGIDPGSAGWHCTLGAISPDDRLYVFDEVYSQREVTEIRFNKLADRVTANLPDEHWRGEDVSIPFFVDTADAQQVMELNLEAARWQDRNPVWNGIRISFSFVALEMGLKARLAGFQRVQQMLLPLKRRATPAVLKADPDDPTDPMQNRPRPEEGEPLIYFMSGILTRWQGVDRVYNECRLLWEIMLYSWLDPHRGTTTQRDDADENSADGAHAMASFRYLIMSRWGPLTDEDEDEEEIPSDPLKAYSQSFHRAMAKKIKAQAEADRSEWEGMQW